jgi:hypothetical protein
MPKNKTAIQEAIFILECKDRWTQSDYQEMARLQELLRNT